MRNVTNQPYAISDIECTKMILPLLFRLSGKVQLTLVWNSQDEQSPNSKKLSELSNVRSLTCY